MAHLGYLTLTSIPLLARVYRDQLACINTGKEPLEGTARAGQLQSTVLGTEQV